MQLEVLKEREMPLLSRKRVTLTVKDAMGTVSRHELVDEIARRLNVTRNLVIIKHIYPQFGTRSAKIIANIYEDEARMSIFEHKNLIAKHVPKAKSES